MKTINSILIFLLFASTMLIADDGIKEKFEKIQMNINSENYLIFEDDALIICDRNTDEYLVEITPQFELYIRSKKITMDSDQQDLLEDYYYAQRTLFSKRNSIGAKGVKIGIQSAELAVKAVGGAITLVASGFDKETEKEFEEEMEREAEKIEYHAENLEEDANIAEDQIYKINQLERKIRVEVDALAEFDLSVDDEKISFLHD